MRQHEKHTLCTRSGMAPFNLNTKNRGQFKGKYFNNKFAQSSSSHIVKKKRKWIPENKVFEGGLKEGQGFAFKRKEKVKHEYNKLLRKERKKGKTSNFEMEEEYPEHLKHLYLAEKQRLDEEELENKNKRWKGRALDVDTDTDLEQTALLESPEKPIPSSEPDISLDQTSVPGSSEEPAQSVSSHKFNFHQRKQKNLSSYQKSKQEYERIKKERERKREEFLKDKAQREEALQKYQEKKKARYQLLKKKTKKGQPNLNLQMELLLEKIQAQRK